MRHNWYLCDLGCCQVFDESMFGLQDSFYLNGALFDVARCAEQVLHPQLGQCKWFHKGLEPNAEGSSWLHWNHLHSWSALDRLEWTRHTHHWILSPTRPSVPWFFDLHSRQPMMVPAGAPPRGPGSIFANGLPMAALCLV